MGKTGDEIHKKRQWLYNYYNPAEHGYNVSYRGRSQFLDKVTDRTGRVVAEITYFVPETDDPFDPSLGRVKQVTGEEGELDYTYETCGDYSNEGFCTEFTNRRYGLYSKITIDDTTGYIKELILQNSTGLQHFSEQQYCYYTGSNKLAYFKELYDTGVYHYTRYEYDSKGAMTKLVRNACPYNETTCAPIQSGGCENNELIWNYTYLEADNMPVKIQTIDAPTNYQSMKYEYYPDWSLHYIHRKDTGGVYHIISEFTYYSDGSVHTSKDALEKVTEYWYYNEEADQVKNGKLKQVSYPANNDRLQKPTYHYTYCSDCPDLDNPEGPRHFSGELIYGPDSQYNLRRIVLNVRSNKNISKNYLNYLWNAIAEHGVSAFLPA